MALVRKSQMGKGPGDGKMTFPVDPQKEFGRRFGSAGGAANGATTLENFMEGKYNENMSNLAKQDTRLTGIFGDQGKYLFGMGYRGRFMKDPSGNEVYVVAPMQDARGTYTKEGDKQVAFVYVGGSKTAKKALIKDGVITDYESGGREGAGGYSSQDVIGDAFNRYSSALNKMGTSVNKGENFETTVDGKKRIYQTTGSEGASAGTGTGVKASEFEEKAGEKIGVKDRKRKAPTLKTGTKSYPSDKTKK